MPPLRRGIRNVRTDVIVVLGTRPECVKLAPVIRELLAQGLPTVIVNSGQHAVTVNRILSEFGIQRDIELAPLPVFPRIAAASEHLETELRAVIKRVNPRIVLVQGDTLTAYAGARAARRLGCELGHVEAGLRTDDALEPFPEEWFRRQITRYATLHFAPCASAVENLRAEGIHDAVIHHVGNPGIDSLQSVLAQGCDRPDPRLGSFALVTIHRRENQDKRVEAICDSLAALVSARKELKLVFPVHPNPRVVESAHRRLGELASCALVEPFGYRKFIGYALDASLIISDSGGIQEEAPHLGTPLLVPRRNTERPEAVATGFVRLTGRKLDDIASMAISLLEGPRLPRIAIDRAAPYGAGDASERIVRVLRSTLRESGA